jgi:hypothetical protein
MNPCLLEPTLMRVADCREPLPERQYPRRRTAINVDRRRIEPSARHALGELARFHAPPSTVPSLPQKRVLDG